VTVSLAEVRSQPVSVLGAVNRPGVQQIDSPKTVVEMLSLAGGLREDAGHTIKITRRVDSGPIPLAAARTDTSGRFSVAEINVKDVLEARRPEDNIVILAHDVISVPRAEMVYVIGEVEKSGGFVLEDRESVSVLQALSLAGGLTDVAGIEQARILRGGEGDAEKRSEGRGEVGGDSGLGQEAGQSPAQKAGEASAQSAAEGSAQGAREGPAQGAEGSAQSAGRKRGERVEIAVNLKAIMAGESPDVALESEDILFVPRSGKRAAGQAVKRLAIGTLSGIAIWRVGSR
jgi:protein involved in polysaccharide export with SLBB domain